MILGAISFSGLSPAPNHAAKEVVYRQQWTTSPAFSTQPVKDVTKEAEKYYVNKLKQEGFYPSGAHSKYVTSPEVKKNVLRMWYAELSINLS